MFSLDKASKVTTVLHIYMGDFSQRFLYRIWAKMSLPVWLFLGLVRILIALSWSFGTFYFLRLIWFIFRKVNFFMFLNYYNILISKINLKSFIFSYSSEIIFTIISNPKFIVPILFLYIYIYIYKSEYTIRMWIVKCCLKSEQDDCWDREKNKNIAGIHMPWRGKEDMKRNPSGRTQSA